MSDLIDTFARAAGPLPGTVSDSGDVWDSAGSIGDSLHTSGAGSLYCADTSGHYYITSGWSAPAADYACSAVLGPDFIADSTAFGGPVVRGSGGIGTFTGYSLEYGYTSLATVTLLRWLDTATPAALATYDLATGAAAGQAITLRAVTQGDGSVQLAAYQGTTVVGTYTDRDGSQITAAGKAGVALFQASANTRMLAEVWAGTSGGPSAIGAAPAAAARPRGGPGRRRGRLSRRVLDFPVRPVRPDRTG